MTRHRRLLAIVCVATVLAVGVLPGVVYVLCDALVPLGPLFGLVVCAIAPPADDVSLPAAPTLTVLAPRAPPAA
jgi:hypothetical protein